MNPKKFANRLAIVLLILAALFSVHFVLNNPLFAVAGIEVTGNQRISSDEVVVLSGIVPGMNIFRFDTQTSGQAIESNPLVKKAQITRHLNRMVAITISERQTWAVVPYGDSYLCLDENGVCFDKAGDLPQGDALIVTMPSLAEPVVMGQALNSAATELIRRVWVGLSSEQQSQISEFHYADTGNMLYIYTIRGTEIRFGDAQRLEEKLQSFAQAIEIENEMEASGKEVLEYIDLRFKGEPIVKTKA